MQGEERGRFKEIGLDRTMLVWQKRRSSKGQKEARKMVFLEELGELV